MNTYSSTSNGPTGGRNGDDAGRSKLIDGTRRLSLLNNSYATSTPSQTVKDSDDFTSVEQVFPLQLKSIAISNSLDDLVHVLYEIHDESNALMKCETFPVDEGWRWPALTERIQPDSNVARLYKFSRTYRQLWSKHKHSVEELLDGIQELLDEMRPMEHDWILRRIAYDFEARDRGRYHKHFTKRFELPR